MKVNEVITKPIAVPQMQEPLVLSPRQQSAAVSRAKKHKLKSLIAQRQAQQRNDASTIIAKQDVEDAFVLSGHHKF